VDETRIRYRLEKNSKDNESATEPLISILILNWNGREDVLCLLASLSALDYSKNRLEVIIHDNGSEDGSVRAIRARFEEMQTAGWYRLDLIEWPKNIGIDGFNKAMQVASKDFAYIWVLDNDLEVPPHALRRLLYILEQKPDAGIVGCRSVMYDNPGRTVGGGIRINWWTGRHTLLESDNVIECDSLNGQIMLIRRQVIEKISILFNPFLFYSGQETDLCMRATRAGFMILYDPTVAVPNQCRGSTTIGRQRMTKYIMTRNGVWLMMRYGTLVSRLVFGGYMVLYGLKKLVGGDTLIPTALIDGFIGRRLEPGWWKNFIG